MKVKACVRVYCSVFARTSLAPCPIMREVPVSIAVDAAHLQVCSPQNALIVLAKLFVDHVLRVMHSPPLPRRCPVPRVAPVPQTVVSENPLGACQGAPLGSADCVCFALHPPRAPTGLSPQPPTCAYAAMVFVVALQWALVQHCVSDPLPPSRLKDTLSLEDVRCLASNKHPLQSKNHEL